MRLPWERVVLATLLYTTVLVAMWAATAFFSQTDAIAEPWLAVVIPSSTAGAAAGFAAALSLARPKASHGSLTLLIALSCLAGATALPLLWLLGEGLQGLLSTLQPSEHHFLAFVAGMGITAGIIAALALARLYGGSYRTPSMFD